MERHQHRTTLRLAAGMIKRNLDEDTKTDKYTEPTSKDELDDLEDQ